MIKNFKSLLFTFFVFLIFSTLVRAQISSGDGINPIGGINQNNQGIVKKSRTGICHAPGSTFYSRTDNFIAYKSLDECLKSGGRLPKR